MNELAEAREYGDRWRAIANDKNEENAALRAEVERLTAELNKSVDPQMYDHVVGEVERYRALLDEAVNEPVRGVMWYTTWCDRVRDALSGSTGEPPTCPTCGVDDKENTLLGLHRATFEHPFDELEFCPDPWHRTTEEGPSE